MSSEWPRFPAAATPEISQQALSAMIRGQYSSVYNYSWLKTYVHVMVRLPLLRGTRQTYNIHEVATQRHHPMCSASAPLIQPVCMFRKFSECYIGKHSNLNTSRVLNAVAAGLQDATGPGTAGGPGTATGRVLFIGTVTDPECPVDARVTQVAALDLARRADVLCQPFDFVVVAGSPVIYSSSRCALVVDVVNAIGAPVLWYGRRNSVDAVTVVR
jgi:hypothetical protein